MQKLVVDSNRLSDNMMFLIDHGFEVSANAIHNYCWRCKVNGPYGKLTFVIVQSGGEYYITEWNLDLKQ